MDLECSKKVPSIAELINVRDIEDALKIQARIQTLVEIPNDDTTAASIQEENSVGLIIALDIAYPTRSDLAVTSGVVWDVDEAKVIYEKVTKGHVSFPYHPGLLAFRELPLLFEMTKDTLSFIRSMHQGGQEKLGVTVLCDGAGIAHPRLCGIACHLGVLLNIPSIGVAKNHLSGDYLQDQLLSQRGSHLDLKMQERIVGSVLRSQTNIKPIFVSPGHQISVNQARNLVLKLCHKYRLPEPLRRADHIGRIELRRIEQRAPRSAEQAQKR